MQLTKVYEESKVCTMLPNRGSEASQLDAGCRLQKLCRLMQELGGVECVLCYLRLVYNFLWQPPNIVIKFGDFCEPQPESGGGSYKQQNQHKLR